MAKLLDIFIYDNKEYTLVDFFVCEGLNINCYLGEDYLFTFINNDIEEVITDKSLIEKIKHQEKLNNPEVYYRIAPIIYLISKTKKLVEIKGEELLNVKKMFLKLIKDADLKIGDQLILSRLSKINFIKGASKDCAGFYHPSTNSIVLPSYSNVGDKPTMVHEIIHACGGSLFNLTGALGFTEGGTELTTQRLLGNLNNSGSSLYDVYFNENYGVPGYLFTTAIIRQMEYLIDKSVSKSILLGNLDFFKEFGKKYGNYLLNFLRHRTSKIITNKEIKYFLETQKVLFVTAFDKDIKTVNNLESARNYLLRLKNFEYMIGNIPGDEELVGFVEYYEKKLYEIEEILKTNGFSNLEISNLINEFKHEKVVFRNVDTPASVLFDGINGFVEKIVNEGLKINPEGLECYCGTIGNNNIDLILTYYGEPIYYVKRKRVAWFTKTINSGEVKDEQFSSLDVPKITREDLNFASVINKVIIVKTKKGYKTILGDDEINLDNITNNQVIEFICSIINNRISCIPNYDPNLLINFKKTNSYI